MKDRDIVRIFRYAGLILIFVSAAYLVFNTREERWVHVLFGWIFFTAAIAIHKYSVYRGAYNNFDILSKQVGGIVKKGNYLFFVPHNIRFKYLGRDCQITSSVDLKFDYIIEYTCSIDVEAELRISRLKKSLSRSTPSINEDAFFKEFYVSGQDKGLINGLIRDPGMKSIINAILEDFSQLCVGKDYQARLMASYDTYLTEPQAALANFNKLINLVNFIESLKQIKA